MSRLTAGIVTTLLVVSVLAPGAVGGVTAQDDDTVTVTISIVDSSGDPVGDTDITVSWEDGERNVTTAGNGKAFVDVPSGSDLSIQVDDEEYIRNSPYTVYNVGEQEIEVPVALSGQATIVVESDNGPVENASVEITRDSSEVQSLTTNASGGVQTDRIEQGTYDLQVTKTGYFDNDTATLSLTEDSTTKTVRLESGRVPVTFNVIDEHFENPRPVQSATVRVPSVGYSQQTFDSGDASTRLPVNRQYTVEVTKDGYVTSTVTFNVDEEERSVDISVRRQPELNVEAANSRVVVGESTFVTVTNEYDEPVSGASISIDGDAAGATNSEGQATVPISSEGNVTIEVTNDGLSESVTVEGVAESDDIETAETTQPTTDEQTDEPTDEQTDEPTDEPTDGGSGEDGPGFGVVAALVAVVAAVVLARRH